MSRQSLKAALRAEMKAALQTLTAQQRQAASAAVRDRLRTQSVWDQAKAVLGYAALPDELDLMPLLAEALAADKTVALPRFVASRGVYEAARVTDLGREIVAGRYGIREPGPGCATFPLNRLDLALVPGVCFDVMGWRLGRGRGFYDRLLESVRGVRCGVGLDLQVLDQIPVEPHDAVLDCILTPTRWLCLNRRAV